MARGVTVESEREGVRMSQWVSVVDGLPEVIEEDGVCNVVLVRWAIEIECGSQYQTSNTFYVNKYPEKFTHWMYIPELPK